MRKFQGTFETRKQSFYQCFLNLHNCTFKVISSQPAITCSKLTIEALEQGVKYVQS